MKLIDVKKLLDDNGYKYTQTIVPSRAEFYRKKGFSPSEDTGAFVLLSIPNPNHTKNIELIFSDDSNNPDFYDLELYNFLEAGDVLESSGYEVEGLHGANHNLGKLYIALDIALSL